MDFVELGEIFVGDFAFTCCETFPLVSMSSPVKHAQTESEFPVGASKFFIYTILRSFKNAIKLDK